MSAIVNVVIILASVLNSFPPMTLNAVDSVKNGNPAVVLFSTTNMTGLTLHVLSCSGTSQIQVSGFSVALETAKVQAFVLTGAGYVTFQDASEEWKVNETTGEWTRVNPLRCDWQLTDTLSDEE